MHFVVRNPVNNDRSQELKHEHGLTLSNTV